MSASESKDSSKTQELRDKISSALDEDKLWLAREHYQALTRVCGFDQKVYQEFGTLLLEMREDLVAGKFLFLAGDRSEEANRCINVFLERYKRKKFASIKSQFPRAAQRLKIDEYPDPVRSELKNWNFED